MFLSKKIRRLYASILTPVSLMLIKLMFISKKLIKTLTKMLIQILILLIEKLIKLMFIS